MIRPSEAGSAQRGREEAAGRPDGPRAFLRGATLFLGFGALLYGALYLAAERIAAERAERNRFHLIRTAHPEYDVVILGASHAAVFDYRELNARLEEMTGARILNLSTVGGGITVNRLLLDHFLASRHTRAVVYVLDSFAFYSSAWNEDRLADLNLYRRAPFDPALALRLFRIPEARRSAFAFLTGFTKINDRERFSSDLLPGEGPAFDRTYRPVPQIDRQRLAFLYPVEVEEGSLLESPYLREFEAWVGELQSRGIRVIVVRPPIPERFFTMIPGEDRFDEILAGRLGRLGVDLRDFSGVANDPDLFYDSDHLNERGVLTFFEGYLAPLIAETLGNR